MLLVGLLYVAVLIHNLHESERRSLQLREVSVGDYVSVSIRVVEADVNRSEVRVHIQLRPVGNLAKDRVTPARNLKLFLNAFRGPQEIDFPAGRRMDPIEAEFSLDGDANRYPFDHHQTTLWFLLTAPIRHDRPPTPATPVIPETSPTKETASKQGVHSKTGKPINEQTAGETNVAVPARTAPSIPDLAVGAAAVPISIDLAASIPGIKFSGKISRLQDQDVTGIDLHIRRADNVISVSIVVMVIMMCLAVSLLAMVLRATEVGNQSTLLPLSLSVSLIFGLPALRNNVQPGVPPVGVFGDYVSFIWAEFLVAVSTVIVVWIWIVKSGDRKGLRLN
jgi:Domain of unknown function (DUF4436)